MDRIAWVEADYEEESPTVDVRPETNAVMQQVHNVTGAPYPLPFNNHLYVDTTDRYRGLSFEMLTYDQYSEDFHPSTPGAAAFLTSAQTEISDPEETIVSNTLDQTEVRQTVGNPGDFIHLDFLRAQSMGLEDPAHLGFHGLLGTKFAPKLDDNILFTPFDLSEQDRYVFTTQDGTNTAVNERTWGMVDGANYDFHLRPRTWWVQARCRATFIYADFFEILFDDVEFIVQFRYRPPIIPWRHNVYTTSATQPITDYLGVPVSYDSAIDYSFYYSKSAAQLIAEILKLQWYGWSSAYVLYRVTPATLYIYSEVPQADEVVCTFREYDSIGSAGDTITVKSTRAMDAEYPRTPVGVYWADFFHRLT